MKKSEFVIKIVKEELINGNFGKSGERFLSVREICKRYDVSNKTALNVLRLLETEGLIISIGYKHYLLNGRAKETSPLLTDINPTQKLIGFHLCEIANDFISNIVKIFIEIAKNHGYRVIVLCSNNDAEEEIQNIRQFIRCGCKGFASFSSAYFSYEDFFRRLPVPYVLCGSTNPNLSANYITSTNYVSGKQVAKHLLDCNYKKFVYLGKNPDRESRRKGFEDYLLSNGVLKENIFTFTYQEDEIPADIVSLIVNSSKKTPTAVFCYHDLIAMKLYKTISRCNKNIPQEIGVVGFDNLQIAEILSPKLTSVSYSQKELAEKLFYSLLANIQNDALLPKQEEIFSYLSVKGSTAPLNTTD